MHDAAVDRTTDGAGLVRSTDPRARCGRLRIDGVGVTGRLGCRRSHEALASLSGRVAVDIEIKNIPGEPDFDPERRARGRGASTGALDDVAFVGDVIVSSFNPPSIAASLDVRPEIPTGLLTDVRVSRRRRRSPSRRTRVTRGCCRSPIGSRRRGPTFPGAVHDAGLLLGTWIVDDPARGGGAVAAPGVDAVATNDPRAIGAAARDCRRRDRPDRPEKELPAELRARVSTRSTRVARRDRAGEGGRRRRPPGDPAARPAAQRRRGRVPRRDRACRPRDGRLAPARGRRRLAGVRRGASGPPGPGAAALLGHEDEPDGVRGAARAPCERLIEPARPLRGCGRARFRSLRRRPRRSDQSS